MTNVIRITGLFLMATALAATIAPPIHAQERPDFTGGMSWGHFSETEHAALVWTPNKIFKVRDTLMPAAQEVTEGAGGPSIGGVEGVAWEPWIEWDPTPSALIWTHDKVYTNLNPSFTAEEVTHGLDDLSIANVRGIVWENWDITLVWTGPTALIWTDTQLFAYTPVGGAVEVTAGPGDNSIPNIRGVVWEEWDAPPESGGLTALVWTDIRLYSYHPVHGIAEVTVVPGGAQIGNVQGIAWEHWDPPITTQGPVALIWNPDHLYAFAHANPTQAGEVDGGATGPTVPGVEGAVWQDWHPEEGPMALVWTNNRVHIYHHNFPFTTFEVTEGGGSIGSVRGIAWEPWEGNVGHPFPNPTEALIWTPAEVFQYRSDGFTADEVLLGEASIGGVLGVAWEPWAYAGGHFSEALIWTADELLFHVVDFTGEVLMDGGSVENVRGVAWEFWDGEDTVEGSPEALIWTPDQVFHHTASGIADGEVFEHVTGESIDDVQGIVWESYDNGDTHNAYIWTPTMVLRYPYLAFSADEVKEGENSIYSYDSSLVERIQVTIHQAGHHDFEGAQEGLRTSQSGAGLVGAEAYTEVGYTGSASGAVIGPPSGLPSTHTTYLGGAPYLNTTMLLGPFPVAGAVSGNAMFLFGFGETIGVQDENDLPAGRSASLEQNYPNPFNPATTITYTLAVTGSVDLRIFDAGGRLIRVLCDDVHEEPGRYEVKWDGRDAFGHEVSSGTYFYRLTADAHVETKQMILVR